MLIIATAILVISCSMQEAKVTEVTILYDITDSQTAEINADEILTLFSLEEKWNGAIFRFARLTDVSYNQRATVKLEAKNEWLSNELERNKDITDFKKRVSNIIENRKANPMGKNNSSLYLPMAIELNRLSKDSASRKILVVYSDLMENTPEINFYRKEDFNSLRSNPEKIKQTFEKQMALYPLTGIEAYLMYQPKNTQDDQSFQTVSGFYKGLLESKGVQVTLSANLTL